MDPISVHCVSNLLYAQVAEEYNVSVASVERNIRFAIQRAWAEDGAERFGRYFGGGKPARYTPTNREFIAVLTDHLLHGKKQEPVQLKMLI